MMNLIIDSKSIYLFGGNTNLLTSTEIIIADIYKKLKILLANIAINFEYIESLCDSDTIGKIEIGNLIIEMLDNNKVIISLTIYDLIIETDKCYFKSMCRTIYFNEFVNISSKLSRKIRLGDISIQLLPSSNLPKSYTQHYSTYYKLFDVTKSWIRESTLSQVIDQIFLLSDSVELYKYDMVKIINSSDFINKFNNYSESHIMLMSDIEDSLLSFFN